MNKLQIFNNTEFGEIRTIDENGKILFCGSDIAKALGYIRPNEAISSHCRYTVKHRIGVQTGLKKDGAPAMQNIEMSFIPEGDLYRLIANSKLPTAQQFETWVFDEVLPSVRKHGAYMTTETIEQAILNPDTLIKLATTLKEEQTKNKQLEETNNTLLLDNQTMKPKAEYFDEMVNRNLLTTIRETAQQLNIKESIFIRLLIDKKYLYRDNKGKLTPYSNKNKGLFAVKERYNSKSNWEGTQTYITPKGREMFRLLYSKNNAE